MNLGTKFENIKTKLISSITALVLFCVLAFLMIQVIQDIAKVTLLIYDKTYASHQQRVMLLAGGYFLIFVAIIVFIVIILSVPKMSKTIGEWFKHKALNSVNNQVPKEESSNNHDA
jgi:nitrogen fixation/metabolism regulation signal transduction histidine kinase